jgi:hypothetical protein
MIVLKEIMGHVNFRKEPVKEIGGLQVTIKERTVSGGMKDHDLGEI